MNVGVRSVGLADMVQAFAPHQPIVVLDEQTGARQLIWSELDANATSPENRNLLIHPGRNFIEGHTYVAALRNLRDASGHVIAAPSWFAALRGGRALPAAERSQRARYRHIFRALRFYGPDFILGIFNGLAGLATGNFNG